MESAGEIVPILAVASRAERATMRAAREMARRRAEQQGRVAHIELKDGLAITKPELERLTTCHRSTYTKLDWRAIAERQPLRPPARTHELEKAARRALATYQPTWQERMFGDEAQRRRQLTSRVFEAAREDEVAFQKARQATALFNAEAELAGKLLELDCKAIKEAVGLKTRLGELKDGLNAVSLAKGGGGRLIAMAEAIQPGDVAYERITDEARARRELIPEPERRQIHLAALCALALRVGGELVSLLPVEALEVAVGCEMPGPDGGRPAPQPVIQLVMTAKAIAAADWRKDDAVSVATRLGARMDWCIEKGFTPIRLVPMSPGKLAA